MRAGRFLAFAAFVPLFPASAADVVFGGTAQVRLGYADNPFLQPNSPGGSAQIGGTIAPRLTRTTALGETVLSGSYDRQQYLSNYDYSDSIAADLRHAQRFNERVRGAFHVGYSNSLNPFIGGNLNQQNFDPNVIDRSIVDQLTVGQRTRQVTGDADIDWTPTERDNFSVGGNATRSTYQRSTSGLLASNYTSYGGNFSYLRAFGGRTKVGLSFAVNNTDSGIYGSSRSFQPNVVLQQQISQIWAFNGSVGGIFQKTGAPFRRSSHSLGFNASLCGTYPRHSMCFSGSRQTSASGIGGLRTDLRFAANVSYRIDQRSRISASADMSTSKTKDFVGLGNQKFRQASFDYSRDVTQRISVGFGGRYQWRDYQIQGKAHALAGTVNLSARFGRTK